MNIVDVILSHATHAAYFYVGLFLILGGMGMPFPEELILLSAGYLVGVGLARWWIMLPFILGIVITCDNGIFYASRRLGRQSVRKWGHYIFVPVQRLERLELYYKKHGTKAVFLSRLVMGFRLPGIIIAGITKIPWNKFFLYDSLCVVIYLPFLLGLGYWFHYNLSLVLSKFTLVKHAIFISVVILLFVFIVRRVFYQIRK